MDKDKKHHVLTCHNGEAEKLKKVVVIFIAKPCAAHEDVHVDGGGGGGRGGASDLQLPTLWLKSMDRALCLMCASLQQGNAPPHNLPTLRSIPCNCRWMAFLSMTA